MGVFDSVMVPCAKCNNLLEFQSKGAMDPFMHTYNLENAPDDVMTDINRHAPIECSICKEKNVVVDGFNGRKVFAIKAI